MGRQMRAPCGRRRNTAHVRRFASLLILGALSAAVAFAPSPSRVLHGFVPGPTPPQGAERARREVLLGAGAAIWSAAASMPARASLPTKITGIRIMKDPRSSLGIGIDQTDQDDGIVIDSIDANGLVQKWNDANPDKALKVMDRIVEVNKLTDKKSILNECQQGSKPLQIVVERGVKEPDAMQIDGRSKSASRVEMNGRWSVDFGNKVNGRNVYKKDGTPGYYLMLNDCGQMQVNSKSDGACNGFAVETADGWKIDGEVDPQVKLSPWRPVGDPYAEKALWD
mmetsp:Transcript_74616/g.207403  ORF Transcript_74616/g.207403 Transcript_74616/m.207403 type:complete len:282 (-) Transcript_74616:270-1115(-)